VTRANPFRPFRPDPAQVALRPCVSGNHINGLGETVPRAPSMVYWAQDPDTIPHGAMQRWFYQVDPDNPHLASARAARAGLLAEPMPEVEGAAVQRSPEEWNAALSAFARSADFEMWGVAAMDPAWIYEGQQAAQSRIIVLGVAHEYAAIATAPAATAGAEVVRQYGRAAAAAKAVSAWLRRQGWEAEPVTGPMTTKVADQRRIRLVIQAVGGADRCATCTDGEARVPRRRVLQELPHLRRRLPARGDCAGQADGARHREVVCRFRPLPAVFQSDPRLRHLHRGVPVEPPRHRDEPRGQAGSARRNPYFLRIFCAAPVACCRLSDMPISTPLTSAA
jgi:hypothetical protein